MKSTQKTGPNSHKPHSNSNTKRIIAIAITAVVAVVLGVFVINSVVNQSSGEAVATVSGKEIKVDNPTTLLESPTGINKISDKIDLAVLSSRYPNVDKSNINATIDSLKSTYGDDYLKQAESLIGYPISNEQDIRDYLTLSLYTEELFKEFVPVSDEEIQAAYEKSYTEEVCARHILIEDEAQAQKVLDAIKAGTYTVEEVVAKQSIVGEGITIKEASDLSCFRKDKMVAEFADAAFALEKDTTTDSLVQSQFGYHIINVYDKKSYELTDELKAEITTDLQAAEKTRANYEKFMADLRSEAAIEFTNDEVKTAYDELMTKLTTPTE